MFKKKNLNIDVFQSNTEKLLLENSALITGSTVITNAGSLENKGFEIEFYHKIKQKILLGLLIYSVTSQK
jgi:hypothetical protein